MLIGFDNTPRSRAEGSPVAKCNQRAESIIPGSGGEGGGVLLKMERGGEEGGGPCSRGGSAVEAPRAILTIDSLLFRSPSALFHAITDHSDLTGVTEVFTFRTARLPVYLRCPSH